MKSHKRIWWLYWCFQIFLILFLALKVSAQHSFVIRTMLNSVLPATTFSFSLDVDKPEGTDSPSVIDDYFRNDKSAWQERLNVEHIFDPISGVDTGKHKDITCYSVTSTGAISGTSISASGALSSTGDFTVNSNKFTVTASSGNTAIAGTLGVTGIATLGDSSQMASSAAPTADADIANKKYVDDQDTADHPAYTGGESHTDGSGLIIKTGYIARSGTSTTVTFGTAFPNAVVSAQVTVKHTNITSSLHAISALSTSAMTIITDGEDSTGYYWFAIGY